MRHSSKCSHPREARPQEISLPQQPPASGGTAQDVDPVAVGLVAPGWQEEPQERSDILVNSCPVQTEDVNTRDSVCRCAGAHARKGRRPQRMSSVCTCSLKQVFGSRCKNVQKVILRALPSGPSERNACLWTLARGLAGVLGQTTEMSLLEVAVRAWHSLAQPVIGTKDFVISWEDFVRAWREVRWPEDQKIEDVMVLARTAAAPKCASYHKDEKMSLLVSVCFLLQQRQQDQPFWLSITDAMSILRCRSRQTAWKKLRQLERDGVLQLVQRGVPFSARATRYRFIGAV
jgi:hypothetical protein